MGTTVRFDEHQFGRLLQALAGDEKRLGVIVENANSEVMARVRADNEIRAELAATALEVATLRSALTRLVQALDAEDGE